MNILAGYKTYLAAGGLVAVVLVEQGLGVDIPGVSLQGDWMLVLLNALGLGGLRAAVGR